MKRVTKRAAAGAAAVLLIGGVTVWLGARTTTLDHGPPPMSWEECRPEQVEVMVLGTFHFSQQEAVDVHSERRQRELADLLRSLERFAPHRVAVEYPRARDEELNRSYRRYLELPADSLASSNEIAQIGFRLARRLEHDRVHGVDVPIELWNDSIRVFDERFPGARERLRDRWDVRYPPAPEPDPELTMSENLRVWNTDAPRSIPEFGRFMPLVREDVYAGALKLRPWFDRNLRTVQNLLRIAETPGDRVLLVIGGSHVRVLRQIMDMTPQLCAVDPSPYLERSGAGGEERGRAP